MNVIEVIQLATVAILLLSIWKMHGRVKDLESSQSGMSIMVEFLLEGAGLSREDWGPVMESYLRRELGIESDTDLPEQLG